MWIVLLTCETHLVYTVRAPVRGPTRAIESLHRAGVESRSLAEDFDTSPATGKLQLAMVFAFSEWWRNSIRERSVAGRRPFPRPTAQPDRAAKGVHSGETVEGSEPAGIGQAPSGQPLDHPTGRVGQEMYARHGTWPAGSLASYAGRTLPATARRGIMIPIRSGPPGDFEQSRRLAPTWRASPSAKSLKTPV